MSKSINGAILGLLVFLVVYCLCFWFQAMPKYYPNLGEIRWSSLPGKHIMVKFVGSALVAMAAGLAAMLIGRRLPERSGVALHLAMWAVMVAACIYLVGRETAEYLLK